MIKAVIFDCFGVLYPQAAGIFFQKHSFDTSVLDKLNSQIDLGQITRQKFFDGLEEKLGISAEKIQAEIDGELVVDQQLIDLIKKLKTKYKIALLSNAGEEEIAIIYRDGIESLFDVIEVSFATGLVKPDAESFLHCAKKLGVASSECLFVDDSVTNIAGAKNAGMQALHYSEFGKVPQELNDLLL